MFNLNLSFNTLHKMTGQSCAAVCVVLCILAATAHSFRLPEVPSMYDDEYGKCSILLRAKYTFCDPSPNL